MADDDQKNKKALTQSRKMLKDLGIDPEQIARESRHELMVPRMALIGVFDTIQKFCEIGKNTVINSIGPLNTKGLKVFFSAIKGSLDMADRTLKEYQETQLRLAAKETVDALAKLFREEETPIPDDIQDNPSETDMSIYDKVAAPLEDLEPENDTPDPEDTSGFGGSFEKFKKSGKLVN
jgi:hypothetical protein